MGQDEWKNEKQIKLFKWSYYKIQLLNNKNAKNINNNQKHWS